MPTRALGNGHTVRDVSALAGDRRIPSAAMDDATGGDVETEPESTGVAAADSALDRLRDVATAPLEEHVEIFDDVQRRLHEGLAELDDEQ
jgi:hypothetical protein